MGFICLQLFLERHWITWYDTFFINKKFTWACTIDKRPQLLLLPIECIIEPHRTTWYVKHIHSFNLRNLFRLQINQMRLKIEYFVNSSNFITIGNIFDINTLFNLCKYLSEIILFPKYKWRHKLKSITVTNFLVWEVGILRWSIADELLCVLLAYCG